MLRDFSRWEGVNILDFLFCLILGFAHGRRASGVCVLHWLYYVGAGRLTLGAEIVVLPQRALCIHSRTQFE